MVTAMLIIRDKFAGCDDGNRFLLRVFVHSTTSIINIITMKCYLVTIESKEIEEFFFFRVWTRLDQNFYCLVWLSYTYI